MKCQRGEAKVEFYVSLNEIKEEYKNGIVVLKILYKKLKKDKGWKMGYTAFYTYAKIELINQTNKNIQEVIQLAPEVIKEEVEPKLSEVDEDNEIQANMEEFANNFKHLTETK